MIGLKGELVELADNSSKLLLVVGALDGVSQLLHSGLVDLTNKYNMDDDDHKSFTLRVHSSLSLPLAIISLSSLCSSIHVLKLLVNPLASWKRFL